MHVALDGASPKIEVHPSYGGGESSQVNFYGYSRELLWRCVHGFLAKRTPSEVLDRKRQIRLQWTLATQVIINGVMMLDDPDDFLDCAGDSSSEIRPIPAASKPKDRYANALGAQMHETCTCPLCQQTLADDEPTGLNMECFQWLCTRSTGRLTAHYKRCQVDGDCPLCSLALACDTLADSNPDSLLLLYSCNPGLWLLYEKKCTRLLWRLYHQAPVDGGEVVFPVQLKRSV